MSPVLRFNAVRGLQYGGLYKFKFQSVSASQPETMFKKYIKSCCGLGEGVL
jgi:hypothetical protein